LSGATLATTFSFIDYTLQNFIDQKVNRTTSNIIDLHPFHLDGNNAAYARAHTRPNNSRHDMSDNARAPGLNNGKQ
jgi:hypothetical protein